MKNKFKNKYGINLKRKSGLNLLMWYLDEELWWALCNLAPMKLWIRIRSGIPWIWSSLLFCACWGCFLGYRITTHDGSLWFNSFELKIVVGFWILWFVDLKFELPKIIWFSNLVITTLIGCWKVYDYTMFYLIFLMRLCNLCIL